MRGLMESLMTLARMDSPEQGLAKRFFDLARAAADGAESLMPLAAERSVHLQIECGATVPAFADPDRIGQVIANLVTNAIRYNRPGGRVRVSAGRAADGGAVLTVADTGVGIPAAELPHVFERFYRVDKARSRAAGGSGLGPAICKSIFEAHGGSISAESTPDAGSTFTVRLPPAPPGTPAPASKVLRAAWDAEAT